MFKRHQNTVQCFSALNSYGFRFIFLVIQTKNLLSCSNLGLLRRKSCFEGYWARPLCILDLSIPFRSCRFPCKCTFPPQRAVFLVECLLEDLWNSWSEFSCCLKHVLWVPTFPDPDHTFSLCVLDCVFLLKLWYWLKQFYLLILSYDHVSFNLKSRQMKILMIFYFLSNSSNIFIEV